MLSTIAFALSLAAPTPLKFEIVDASLFKNNYAFVTREAPVPESGEYVLADIPQSATGTLWFFATPGTTIESVISTSETRPTAKSVDDMEGLLDQNVGKDVVLELTTNVSMSGKILNATPRVLILDVGGRQVAIFKSLVRSVQSAQTLNTNVSGTNEVKVLRFKVKAGPHAALRMVGLDSGLGWSPAYFVDMGKKELTLTAKATIRNDLDRILDKTVKLTNGFPNVPFAEYVDPLVAPLGARSLVPEGVDYMTYDPTDNSIVTRGSAPGEMNYARANIAFGEQPGRQMQVTARPAPPAEDLYFYDLPKVTLSKGDRGLYIMSEQKCSFEHLYTCSLADLRGVESDNRPSPKSVQEVWHSLKFQNKSGQPLTSGPATTFKDGNLLGQGMLDYTPIGGDALLRVTRTLDISVEAAEEEINREREAAKPEAHDAYAWITVKGTILVKNSKTEEAKIQIKKNIEGEMVLAGGANVTKTTRGLRDLNPRSTLEWTPSVKAGQSLTMTYSYRVYVKV